MFPKKEAENVGIMEPFLKFNKKIFMVLIKQCN